MIPAWSRPLVLGAILVSCAARSPDEGSRPAGSDPKFPRLVASEELASWIRSRRVTLIDVRSDVVSYLKDHLPGAVYLNPETLRATDGGIPGQLLSARAYRELFARLGISMKAPVVIYSAGETRNIDATFLSWLLAGFGHPEVFLLDGGYFKWQLEQRPLARRYPRVPAVELLEGSFRPELASLAGVREAMAAGDVLVDARPPDQYAGEAGAQMRRGHIPGAISHYWQDDLVQQGFGRVWKSRSELRASYAAQGILPERNIIVYCNSSTEASHVHFALRNLLGYPRVRIYVGSWTEWAERVDLPIEVEKRESGEAGKGSGSR